ncbi:kinesin-like protein [Rhynchospora pubera]|uniref:Kinesin-like protein n=1 Tax=Rhynchospora pubera TaxID=906938 RepID=A0AAV8EJE8_9POAL|nr:kinesin-like protein [Rhynchospora pubera]
MEVLRTLSPVAAAERSGLKTKSLSIDASKSKDQENTPPLHPNLKSITSPSPRKATTPSRLSKSPQKLQTTQSREVSRDLLASDNDASVKVAVRVRPGNETDRIVQKLSGKSLAIGDRKFSFDSVLGPQASQEDVFKSVGLPLVQNALDGYNTSLVCYGQTGSGKTYTMWGPPSAMVGGNPLNTNLGVAPRFFHMLFSEFQRPQEGSEEKKKNFQCRCSFLEIYNEQINDLLDPTQRDLQIREDNANGIHVENLSEEYVNNEEDVAQILIKGLSNRKVGATTMNSKSSRSHVIFTFIVESWCKEESSKCFSSSKCSRITFVDLAGLDRDELDGATKHYTKEERYVKKSLSRLGKLVNILSESAISGKQQKVSYLGSSLTYLLQDTVGGNSKVSFLCLISSDEKSKAATLSTLRFGERAKHIQNKPVINEITEDDVNGLSDKIRQLKEELIKAKSGSNTPGENFSGKNARGSLNLLRVSLNRSLILPRIEIESDEEMEADEEDVSELCAQINNIHSSSDSATLKDVLESDNNEPMDEFSDMEEKEATPSIMINPCQQVSPPIEEPEPTMCSSPKIHLKPRKSIFSSLGLLSVGKDEGASVRTSLQSTKLSATVSLAASLHRGLHIIEEQENRHNNPNPRRSFVGLSFDHLALKSHQSSQKVDSSQGQGAPATFMCSSCKKLVDENRSGSSGSELVPIKEQQEEFTQKDENEVGNKISKRELELEALCAEQEARIRLLVSEVEQFKKDQVLPNTAEVATAPANGDVISSESEHMQEGEECLLEKIRNGELADTDKYMEEVERERQKWTESESRWISLTEELRLELESNRRFAEKNEMELAEEKKCTAELDDAIQRAVLGHGKMVEHYAELQEAYSDLLEKHRRMMEGIAEVKRAAAKAGRKGCGGTAFAAALAAELSTVRIDREKERAQLKEQNRRLRIQLRDTAEAVHAAGELLVRLREAEEALAQAQNNYAGAQQENEKLKKQIEKIKKKHVLEMATMKNYLAESRLPESALEPYYHADPEIVEESSVPVHESQSWRTAFAPAYE